MHIEVFQGKAQDFWYWHFKARNGKFVADAEAFDSKGNAIRAAKGVVRSVLKRCINTGYLTFSQQVQKDGTIRIFWS